MSRLHSFDVFDTLLVRTWARPHDLFLELGRLLAKSGSISITPDRWQKLRQEAEVDSRQTSPRGETTLTSIYDCLSRQLAWTSAQKQAAMNLEIETERKGLQPVPAGVRKLESVRAAGSRIAFLSDMYLPADCLRTFLTAHGLFQPGDLLLISGEEGCSKADGGLFRRLSELAAIPLEQIEHHGDHPQADIAVPRSLGCTVSPMCSARLSLYETALADSLPGDPLYASRLAASARLARLQNPAVLLSREAVLQEVSCAVAGPLLFGYVYWILTRARELGLKRLYFVSRDGQILLKLAQKLQRYLDFSIELRYLFGSRQAWLLPGWAEGLPGTARDKIESEKNSIESEQLSRRNLARAYLLTQGLADGLPWAMVDLGWHGRLQAALGSLLRPDHDLPLTGFYFALSNKAQARSGDRLLTYFAGRIPGLWTAWTTYGTVLELFAAADHGQVTGYLLDSGRNVPVLRGSSNSAALAWGLDIQQSAILAFADYCLELTHLCDWRHENWKQALSVSARLFLQTPSQREAEVYGDYTVSTGLSEDRGRPLAPPRPRWRLIFALLRRGRALAETPWLEGEIVRSLSFSAFWLLFLRSRRRLAFLFERARRRR